MYKAFFLDRDGVINEKAPAHEYIKNWDEFKLLPDIIDVMKYVQSKGYMIFIVTNQRGIARGLMTIEDLLQIHEYLIEKLAKHHVSVTDIFYCPHDISDNCYCRKPKPGMLLKAKELYNIDFKKSYLVGDSITDVMAANSLSITSILYLKNPIKFSISDREQKPSFIIKDLKSVIDII